MIPLHDDNPTTITPLITIVLIVINVFVFLWQVSLPAMEQERVVFALGSIPAVLFGEAVLATDLALVPPELSVITSMFLHGGWLHLIGNMLYLWIFGNNVEDAMGHVRFVVFYLLCGIAAALAQAWQDPTSTIPMIGASGAIGGVLGAYLILHPTARILVLVPLGFLFPVIRVPAVVVLGIWFLMQFLESAARPAGAGGVAYWAHIGGFIAGAVLIFVFKRRQVVLLDRRAGPWG